MVEGKEILGTDEAWWATMSTGDILSTPRLPPQLSSIGLMKLYCRFDFSFHYAPFARFDPRHYVKATSCSCVGLRLICVDCLIQRRLSPRLLSRNCGKTSTTCELPADHGVAGVD
jgi:hypothetical protein